MDPVSAMSWPSLRCQKKSTAKIGAYANSATSASKQDRPASDQTRDPTSGLGMGCRLRETDSERHRRMVSSASCAANVVLPRAAEVAFFTATLPRPTLHGDGLARAHAVGHTHQAC